LDEKKTADATRRIRLVRGEVTRSLLKGKTAKRKKKKNVRAGKKGEGTRKEKGAEHRKGSAKKKMRKKIISRGGLGRYPLRGRRSRKKSARRGNLPERESEKLNQKNVPVVRKTYELERKRQE